MAPILQVLALGMAFRCVGAVSNALLNAQGRFGTVLWFDILTTIIFSVSVGFAAWLGTAIHVAVVVGINVIVRMIFLQQASLQESNITITTAVASYLLPAAVALLASLSAEGAVQYLALWHQVGDLARLVVKGLVFGAVYLCLALVTMHDDVVATGSRLGSIWHRIAIRPGVAASE